ncbi:glycosyltransferase [Methylobacterium sp. WL120]|uniref:glycosyltransferase n=1 Tax=Methylobacterium sp. WL120 TaxID=2603887 RepID=UPI0011C7791A|nr:glycosyltransferase [Methylobacterium sp. WL120]TXM67082.1 glycosyltransferase [Methylobacterium sp. WL120]
MRPSEQAVVCVPARDEEVCLPRLLRSLAAQDGIAADVRLRVLIVANNCTDGTVAAVRAMQAADIAPTLAIRVVEAQLSGAEAHVGTARRMALDAGAAWLEADGCPDGILLTTDADARVPRGWLAANLRALEGAEIVGGRLVIDPEDAVDPALADLHARIERYWASVRRIEDALDPPLHDPAPRHGDHTGASLALRAALYRSVGGLPALPRGEDNALVARVREAGGRLRHCPDVSVMVSDRAAGRAQGGMATEMMRRAATARAGLPYRLPAPRHWETVIARRAALRRTWLGLEGTARHAALAAFGLTVADLAAIDPDACVNDIAFVERASPLCEAADGPAPEMDLDDALAGFDAILRPGAAA